MAGFNLLLDLLGDVHAANPIYDSCDGVTIFVSPWSLEPNR